MNDSPSRCGICRTVLQNPNTKGLEPWWDCGGHCMICMAHAGDPDCIKALREWLDSLERD